MTNDKHQRGAPPVPRRFWILGAGRFGRLATERIVRHIAGAEISVVDQQPVDFADDRVTAIRADGVAWLADTFHRRSAVEMIIPAIPVHVVVDWMKLRLLNVKEICAIDIPDSLLAQIPHALRGKPGQAFASHADFICPDNCPEPKDRCTHTGQPRPKDLFRLLAGLDAGDVCPIVIRSRQLLPGVGGMRPGDLWAALDRLCRLERGRVLVATACRCHGVLDLIGLTACPGGAPAVRSGPIG
jgi:hypothetical protein